MSRRPRPPPVTALACLVLGFGSVASASLLSSCGSSPPMRYYTLKVIAPAANAHEIAANVAAAAGQVPIRLEPVAIPPELDRRELVSRAGPYRVHISDSDRWAAPLEDQIRRTLSDDLAARLPAGLVADPNEPAGNEPRRLLSIAFANLAADDDCEAAIRADWTLRAPNGDAQRGVEQLQIQGGTPCTGAVPAALSTALAQLADRLAAVVSQPNGTTATP
jgi:uncharacterized protein